MRIIFAGTPEFAAEPLRALIAADLAPVAVYTQPDRPAGRGRGLAASPVKQAALAAGIEVRQPATLKADADVEALAALQPDLMVVIAYGLILPQRVLDIPRLGCVNLHASLLPRWRGAAPIQRAIQSGDAATGVCLMKMDAGLDTGPVLACEELAITAEDTGGSLHDRLMASGCEHLPDWLRAYAAGELGEQPQPGDGVTYAHKLTKAEAQVDWTRAAAAIARDVRAFNPWPVCFSPLDGQPVKLWAAHAEPGVAAAAPGSVLEAGADGLRVACGDGVLRVTQLQWPGRKRMDAASACRGRDLKGCVFGG